MLFPDTCKGVYIANPQLGLNAKLAPTYPQSTPTNLPCQVPAFSCTLANSARGLRPWIPPWDEFFMLMEANGIKVYKAELLFLNNNAVICVSLPRERQDTFHKGELLPQARL